MYYYTTFFLFLSFVWTCIHLLLKPSPVGRKPGTAAARPLPPGPRPFPIIGNILQLGDKPHLSLANLSKTYGPVMSLKLGSVFAVVVSSAETAKKVLHGNDQAFCGRPVVDALRTYNHPEAAVVWALAVTPRWRRFRKLCTVEMFSTQRLDAGEGLRRRGVRELLGHVEQCRRRGFAVNIGRAAFTTSLNFLSSTIFSVNLAHHGSDLSQEFRDLVWGMMEEAGKPNLADYFPVLRCIDPQGVRRRTKKYSDKMFDVFDDMISQRLQSEASSSSSAARQDVLDALLNLTKENDSEWSCNDIKDLLLDIIVAGTDTTSSTVEWSMVELLRSPEIMEKAKRELQQVLGNEGMVQESDISKLPYLQAIVKETLRLHPPAPLLVPHRAVTDTELCGFTVPENSQVLVNAWAIARDPTHWLSPDEFAPERFLEREIDVKGRDFEFIPFGSGRRICVGMPLAHRMVHLMLASLLHFCGWKLEDGVTPEDMDMSEKFGITLQKAQPLRAIPIAIEA